MAGKYKPHILDDETFRRSWQAWNEADWYRDAADRLYVNEPLGEIGRGEMAKIGSGRFADTLLGRAFETNRAALRESSARQKARDVEAAKRSGTMGAAAMMRAGNTPGSIGAGILYDRMLQKRTGEIQDRSSDELSRGLAELGRGEAEAMPGYLSQTGQWAEAPNRNVAQQAALRGMYDQAKQAATAMRLSQMTFEKGKSFWDKFKGVIGDIGGIASTVAGLGGLFGGIPGLGAGGAFGRNRTDITGG